MCHSEALAGSPHFHLSLAASKCSFSLPPVPPNLPCHFFSPLVPATFPPFCSLHCCSLNTQKSSNRLLSKCLFHLSLLSPLCLSEIFIFGVSIELLLNFVRTGLFLPPALVSCQLLCWAALWSLCSPFLRLILKSLWILGKV